MKEKFLKIIKSNKFYYTSLCVMVVGYICVIFAFQQINTMIHGANKVYVAVQYIQNSEHDERHEFVENIAEKDPISYKEFKEGFEILEEWSGEESLAELKEYLKKKNDTYVKIVNILTYSQGFMVLLTVYVLGGGILKVFNKVKGIRSKKKVK